MQADRLAPGQRSSLAMKPTNKRFRVMGLLFVTVVINYLDRSNLSIAAPGLASQFAIDPVHMGLVFSAFGWTYTPLQIPGGWRSLPMGWPRSTGRWCRRRRRND